MLYIYVLLSITFYFYFFWPFQIALVIDSTQQIIKTEGYPEEMESLTLREIFSDKWMFNFKPWTQLREVREEEFATVET